MPMMLGKVVGSSGLKLLKPKRWTDPHITGQQAVPSLFAAFSNFLAF